MKKYYDRSFKYYLVLLFVGYILLGLAITLSCRFYFFKQAGMSLVSSATNISKTIINSVDENGEFSQNLFENNIEQFNKYNNQTYVITGPNLRIYALSDDFDIDPEPSTRMYLDSIDILTLSTETVSEFRNVKPTGYSYSQYMISYPVTINKMVFFIYTSIPMFDININVVTSSIVIWAALLVAILIGYYLIMYVQDQNVIQIKAMNEVAQAMANGDFSRRVDVQGNGELSQLCTNFNKMAESLHKQNTFKNEYISNISHDIRSPLTTIKGFAEAIMDGTIPEEKIKKYLEIIYSEADRLTKLGNSLLELNRLDIMNDTLKTERIDLISFLQDCAESMEDKYINKNIELKLDFTDDNIYILADTEKMQRICYNIIDNAIKYTDNGGTITLSARKKESLAIITIADTGIGISSENITHIFDRLYKVDSSRGKDKESVGLGLAIVKELVEAHHQEIGVESELGKGSKFWFTMPLDQ
jgi:signal transduction histidine kinase